MRKRNFNSIPFILIFIHLICGASAYAQQPEFTVTTSTKKVAQHTVFDIQFELQHATGSDFTAPSFEGFRIVGGPSIGSSTMIINGVVSRSQSWSYSLLATKQGNITIGPASIMVGRKKLSTRSTSIEVVAPREIAGKDATTNTREPVILKADLNASSFYPGQQIILTYRLLFRENVQTVSTISEDDYSDFFVQGFSSFSREATFETINGVQFTSRIVKSMALFAHQSGAYTVEPMIMNVGINAPFPGNQGFFTMRRIEDIQVASEPITINILPLPQDAPASFSGSVGQYQIKTYPGNATISTDEAYTLRIDITGNGDSRRWDPPSPVTNGNFELYDPKILEDQLTDVGNEVSHVRSLEYQMIPAKAGDFMVYVPLTFFDPEQKKYITISSDTISLRVSQGTNKRGVTIAQNDNVLKPPALMQVRKPLLKDRFWTSIPHLFIFGLILSGTLLSFVITYRQKKEKNIPEAERVRSMSGQKAREQIMQLASSGSEVSSKAFFENAVAIYYKFLEERFTIPPSELDESTLSKHLTNAGIEETTVDRTKQFYTQCLAVRYGGIPGGYTRDEMIHESLAVIGLLEDGGRIS